MSRDVSTSVDMTRGSAQNLFGFLLFLSLTPAEEDELEEEF
jgi:hypothetical protein